MMSKELVEIFKELYHGNYDARVHFLREQPYIWL
jgi:hypothetical protein